MQKLVRHSFVPRDTTEGTKYGIFVWVNDCDEVVPVSGYEFRVYLNGSSEDYISEVVDGSFHFFDYQLFDGVSLIVPAAKSFTYSLEKERVFETTLCFGRKVFIPAAGNFVQVQGIITDMSGQALSDVRVHVELVNQHSGVEYNGSNFSRNLDSFAITEDDGTWSIFLPPNVGLPTDTTVFPSGSFYIFRVFGEVYKRYIDFNDGLVQQFSELKIPSEYEFRQRMIGDLRPM